MNESINTSASGKRDDLNKTQQKPLSVNPEQASSVSSKRGERVKFGRLGEDLAVKFLEQHGYKILEKNFRNRFGEIDIIAKDKDTLCFVEVKSRSTDEFGSPFESIVFRKQKKMARLAFSYLKKERISFEIKARFDVIAAVKEPDGTLKLDLLKNAFEVIY